MIQNKLWLGVCSAKPGRWATLAGALVILAMSACLSQAQAVRGGSAGGAPPIWAAQFAWAPSNASLGIDFNSATPQNGAYQSTPTVFPAGKNVWRSYTWKLTQVDFAGSQNFNADLRLDGASGIAVHQVTLTLHPPATSDRAALRVLFYHE